MKTLADAWQWYQSTKQNLRLMRRLGEKHWDDPSIRAASIWEDNYFRDLVAADIVDRTRVGLEPIEDLAVLVLFSMFESQVRDYLAELIQPQADRITDPILKEAAESAIQGIKEGSFKSRVLDPLNKQGHIDPNLVTQINQVREYRNWVAHGRRETAINHVTPEMAYQRLEEFLALLGIAAESEEELPDGS